MNSHSEAECVIGIDGGGSTTVVWLSSMAASGTDEPLGRGTAGPSNPLSVGWDVAIENLNAAVDAAIEDAGKLPRSVAAACVALAGGDRENIRQRLVQWADERKLAPQFLPTHDGFALLAAGSSESIGIALVSGTGSFAFGRSHQGQATRSGGWGHLFGDEGSGYAIALAGLRAVVKAADGRGKPTELTRHVLEHLQLAQPAELVNAIYPRSNERTWLASLAEIVMSAAVEGDSAAQTIVEDAAVELAEMVASVAHQLQLDAASFALALSGGVLLHSPLLKERLIASLTKRGLQPEPVCLVNEPVYGAVILARNLTSP